MTYPKQMIPEFKNKKQTKHDF